MTTVRVGHHGPTTFAGESQLNTDQKPSWYTKDVKNISDEGRELLEKYSGVPPDQVVTHVESIRDRAFAIWPYACIGQIRFLSYSIPTLPYYETAISRLRSGATFLDVGCCFGQELRYLTFRESIPAQQLYGFDLEPGFINIGHELFRDRDTFKGKLLSGDLLAERAHSPAQELNELEGTMDIVHAASVLHCWDWNTMFQAAKRLVSFTRVKKGSCIIGNQMGSLNAGEYPMPTGTGFNFRHNNETMQRFWREVGEATDTQWEVKSGMWISDAVRENKNASFAKDDPGIRMIWFMVERL